MNKIPEYRKLDNVNRILHKRDKRVALNNRPVSMTSVAGKALESIIRKFVFFLLLSLFSFYFYAYFFFI